MLDPPRAELRARIAARFETMLDRAALEEALRFGGSGPGLPAAKLLGLRPLQAHGRGNFDPGRSAGRRHHRTRQFAKRQMTWFRHRMATLYLV